MTSNSSWARICSSDVLPRKERMSFSASYTDDLPAPTVKGDRLRGGNGVNSQSGYIDVSWNSVPLASGYSAGHIERQHVPVYRRGHMTLFDARQKRFGRPTLKEPRATIPCTGTEPGRSCPIFLARINRPELLFSWSCLPTPTGRQARSMVRRRLRCRTPRRPTSRLRSAYLRQTGATRRLDGHVGRLDTDMPLNRDTLGDNGHVQFILDPAIGTDANAWAWQNTASNAANGSQIVSTAGLEDGVHAVYVARRRHLRHYGRAQRRGTQGGQNAADAAGRVRTA